MSQNKNILTTDAMGDAARTVGMLMMTAAVTLSTFATSDDRNRAVVPNQPSLVRAIDDTDAANPIRREREEETAPHFISFGTLQRTAARSGKV